MKSLSTDLFFFNHFLLGSLIPNYCLIFTNNFTWKFEMLKTSKCMEMETHFI